LGRESKNKSQEDKKENIENPTKGGQRSCFKKHQSFPSKLDELVT
jgi:hypothetical protein